MILTSGDLDSFGFDGRANRLREAEIRINPFRLMLCADTAVFLQIRRFLAGEGLVPRAAPYPASEADRWTHCMAIDQVPTELDSFLNLLGHVLVLKNLKSEIDDAIALDFYKIPREGVDPNDWPDTEVGDLVSKMKYWKNDALTQAHARSDLAARMASVIDRHPTYRDALLISTPGHSSIATSQSEALASEVAGLRRAPIAAARARSLFRPEAKARGERVDLRDEFELSSASVSSRSVLILDDVLGRGTTMQGVASAARRAGARSVHGLVAARTIR